MKKKQEVGALVTYEESVPHRAFLYEVSFIWFQGAGIGDRKWCNWSIPGESTWKFFHVWYGWPKGNHGK